MSTIPAIRRRARNGRVPCNSLNCKVQCVHGTEWQKPQSSDQGCCCPCCELYLQCYALSGKCLRCHQPPGIAPLQSDDYNDDIHKDNPFNIDPTTDRCMHDGLWETFPITVRIQPSRCSKVISGDRCTGICRHGDLAGLDYFWMLLENGGHQCTSCLLICNHRTATPGRSCEFCANTKPNTQEVSNVFEQIRLRSS